MLRRELRLNVEDLESDSLVRPSSAGAAFLLLALVAVAPSFPVGRELALTLSVALSLAALFVLGSRVFIPRNFKPVAGLESALVGGVAGGLLYLVGILVSRL